jgi:hypothetical protein
LIFVSYTASMRQKTKGPHKSPKVHGINSELALQFLISLCLSSLKMGVSGLITTRSLYHILARSRFYNEIFSTASSLLPEFREEV